MRAKQKIENLKSDPGSHRDRMLKSENHSAKHQGERLESLIITSLPVMEAFYTLQGEGFHQGKAAYFIRLGGCDVGCIWCDVKDSWDSGKHPLVNIDDLIQGVERTPAKLVVITGGEPLMHELSYLTSALQAKGFQTNIETSGAYPLSGTWDWICLSPKKFKAPLPGILAFA